MPRQQPAARLSHESEAMRNARMLGDRFVAWQSPYGATDRKKCPYRSPTGTATISVVQGIGPQVRALYQLLQGDWFRKI